MMPECSIDYQRDFSLPCGIAPESLGTAERLQFALTLRIGGNIERSTIDGYRHRGAYPFKNMTPISYSDGSGAKILLPQHTSISISEPHITLSNSQISSVLHGGTIFSNYVIPAGLNQIEISDEVSKQIFRDKVSRRITPLATSATMLDGMEFFWPHVADAGFTGVLGLDLNGVLPIAGVLPPYLPEFLLETWKTATSIEIGEVDRLLLRSPVAGRYRFEPYFHYKEEGGNLTIAGRSNCGRLVIKANAVRPSAQVTDTRLYHSQDFVFENVDRVSVVEFMYRHLIFQIGNFLIIDEQYTKRTRNEPRIAISRKKKILYITIRNAIQRCLRSWLAFLAILAPTPQDQALANSLPSEWWTKLVAPSISGKQMMPIIQTIIDNPSMQEAFFHFLKNYYIPIICGFSWAEVLTAQSVDPAIKFPIPEDMPPKNPVDNVLLRKALVLEAINDHNSDWIACYSGAPLGRPASVYGDTAVTNDSLIKPDNAVTCYELEAVLIAQRSNEVVTGTVLHAASLPRPGRAADLTTLDSKKIGYCATLYLRDGVDRVRTTIDWFQELTQGINVRREEDPIIELEKYVDLETGKGHPLYRALKFDQYLQAKNLRRQMDDADATTIEADSLSFWDSKLNIPMDGPNWDLSNPAEAFFKLPPGPSDPFRSSRTRFTKYSGVVDHDDRRLSGFDNFDIQSAMQARDHMKNLITDRFDLPLPVILALMQREGIFSFAFLNRFVKPTRNSANVLSWKAHHTSFSQPTTTQPNFSRQWWLLWPYGLDHFAKSVPSEFDSRVQAIIDDGILTPEPDEHLRKYIDERIWGSWSGTALSGVPTIWKRSRRSHWAMVSLMVGFFQHVQKSIHEKAAGFDHHDDWINTDVVDLTGAGLAPNDDSWRHFITYYSMIYRGYNAGLSWDNDLNAAYAARPAGRSLRDHLFFHHDRTRLRTHNMVRFGIALDAYMRLDLLTNKTADQYATATPELMAINRSGWGA